MNTNAKGNIALGWAIAYFTNNLYTVSLPLNDSQCYDLIIEKNGVLQTVQVKYSGELARNGIDYKCTLKTTSGTSRDKLYSIVDTIVDLLFCYCSNGDIYIIPVKEITNVNSVTLSKIPLKNAFDTSKYYIQGWQSGRKFNQAN